MGGGRRKWQWWVKESSFISKVWTSFKKLSTCKKLICIWSHYEYLHGSKPYIALWIAKWHATRTNYMQLKCRHWSPNLYYNMKLLRLITDILLFKFSQENCFVMYVLLLWEFWVSDTCALISDPFEGQKYIAMFPQNCPCHRSSVGSIDALNLNPCPM